MNKKLVMILTDILNELGAADIIDSIKGIYGNLREDELIQVIEELLESDEEHSVTEGLIGVYVDFHEDQLRENEVLVFEGNKFEYKDFLLSLLALLRLVDKPKDRC